jgi:hypothetical protein
VGEEPVEGHGFERSEGVPLVKSPEEALRPGREAVRLLLDSVELRFEVGSRAGQLGGDAEPGAGSGVQEMSRGGGARASRVSMRAAIRSKVRASAELVAAGGPARAEVAATEPLDGLWSRTGYRWYASA